MSAATRGGGVAITGVGVVSAAVTGNSAALGAFLAAPAPPPDEALAPGAMAALVDPAEARRLSRVCQLTIGAARLAMRESGVDPRLWLPEAPDYYRYALSRTAISGLLFSVQRVEELGELAAALDRGGLIPDEEDHLDELVGLIDSLAARASQAAAR